MAREGCVERPLFGGAISSAFPLRFQDLSNIRDVPDHQEAFADPSRDESIIFEILDLKHEVGDEGSAAWFLRDLAAEQDAESSMVLEHSSAVEAFPSSYNGVPSTITTAIGQMAISKGRQGREAGNIVRVYLADLRLRGVESDVLITVYEPIVIKEFLLSSICMSSNQNWGGDAGAHRPLSLLPNTNCSLKCHRETPSSSFTTLTISHPLLHTASRNARSANSHSCSTSPLPPPAH